MRQKFVGILLVGFLAVVVSVVSPIYIARTFLPPAMMVAPSSESTPDPRPMSHSSESNPAIALDGYCPVRIRERKQWTRGSDQWTETRDGRVYRFAGLEEWQRFRASPERYMPVASGNDVVLSKNGVNVQGDRRHGLWIGDRMFLFATEASLQTFWRDRDSYCNQEFSVPTETAQESNRP